CPALRPGQQRPRGTRRHPLAGRPHPDHRRPQDANASHDRGTTMSHGAPGRTAGAVDGPATPQAGFAAFKPFLAPILISCILAAGHFWYGILDGRGGIGTLLAILAAVALEVALARYATG